MTVVTSHPPAYLPGLSVIRRVAEADVVLWLDEVRYTTPGWMDRNRLPDGTWLTVPVKREGPRALLREVRIVGNGWQRGHLQALRSAYATAPHFDEHLLRIIDGDWGDHRLTLLTGALASRILSALGIETREVHQSDYRLGGRSTSERLVRAVRALGGDVYLSGPGGWRYLDPDVFAREGVELRYHSHVGANPCIVDSLFRAGTIEEVAGAAQS